MRCCAFLFFFFVLFFCCCSFSPFVSLRSKIGRVICKKGGGQKLHGTVTVTYNNQQHRIYWLVPNSGCVSCDRVALFALFIVHGGCG